MLIDIGMLILLSGFLSGITVGLLMIGIRERKRSSHWMTIRQQDSIKNEDKKELFAVLQKEANAAGLQIPAAHIISAGIIGSLAGAAIAIAVTGKITLAILGLLAGIVVPGTWIKRRVEGRSAAFEAQLEVVLGQMASSLRAGQNIQQALEQAALAAVAPARDVLGKALHLMRTGHNPVRAMEDAGKMIKSRDLEVVAAATGLHMQTGGDLSLVYDQIADGIRDRRSFRAHVGSATSEGRLTSNILVAIPFISLGGFRAVNPEYMAPLFNTPSGIKILILCTVLIIIGYIWVKRIATVDY